MAGVYWKNGKGKVGSCSALRVVRLIQHGKLMKGPSGEQPDMAYFF